jgi:hypothetical protein
MAFVGELLSGGERVRTLAFWRDGAGADNIEYALAGSPCVTAFDRKGVVVHARNAAQLFPLDEGLRRLGAEGYAGTSLYRSNGDPLGILVVLTRKPIERPRLAEVVLELCAARTGAEIERARDDATMRGRLAELETRLAKSRRVGSATNARPTTPRR